MAALSRAGVVSDHVTEPEGHRGVAVVHRHYDDLLVRGALRQAGLVQDRLRGEKNSLISGEITEHLPFLSEGGAVEKMRTKTTPQTLPMLSTFMSIFSKLIHHRLI